MPNRTNLPTAVNETRVGTTRAGNPDGIFFIECPAGKVSVLALQGTDGVTHYFWTTTAGVLRHDTAVPTTPATDGSAV